MGCLGFIAATLGGDVISDPLLNKNARARARAHKHGDVHQSAVGGAQGPIRISLIKMKTLNLHGLLLLLRVGRASDAGSAKCKQNNI